MPLFIVLTTIITLLQLAYYMLCTPHPIRQLPSPSIAEKLFAQAAYDIAYVLALLRLPFAISPYGFKLLVFLVSRQQYSVSHNQYLIEALRICGDVFNLAIGIVLFQHIRPLSEPAYALLMLCAAAEAIRLFAEKGQMVFSAVWQSLPHRALTEVLASKFTFLPDFLRIRIGWYCQYYSLNDEDRGAYILDILRLAPPDSETSQKLGYVTKFKIVPESTGLRGGQVRDIARGEVFIHRRWTNDPWLLIGQALRRSPWVFDPRYLPRPFYYRSQSNRMATLFVLQHARYCLSYALYQFGHEIKAARYDLFYRLCRCLGYDIEPLVQADGTFPFDQFISWLQHDKSKTSPHRLLADTQVITEVEHRLISGENLSPLDIAVQYSYPLKYVREVLIGKISNFQSSAFHTDEP